MKSALSLLLVCLTANGLTTQDFSTQNVFFESDTLTLAAEVFVPAQPRLKRSGIASIQGSPLQSLGQVFC